MLIDTVHEEIDDAVDHITLARKNLIAVVGLLAVHELDTAEAREAARQLDVVEGKLGEFRAAL